MKEAELSRELGIYARDDRTRLHIRTVEADNQVHSLGFLMQSIGTECGDIVEVFECQDYLIMRKKKEVCHFCKSDAELHPHRGMWFCAACLRELQGIELT